MANTTSLQNPVDKHPSGFTPQEQSLPGTEQEMQPKPDHGEASYKGSGRLAGRKALITGGDSGMGRAAAIAYAREGADVVINYLPDEQPDADEVLALIKKEGRKGQTVDSPYNHHHYHHQFVRILAILEESYIYVHIYLS